MLLRQHLKLKLKMKTKPWLIILLFLPAALLAQTKYKYGLSPVTFADYKASLPAKPQNELINLEKFIPGIVLDIRYATDNNFMKEKIYTLAKAYARKPDVEALKKAQADFKKLGYTIKVFDGYRPSRRHPPRDRRGPGSWWRRRAPRRPRRWRRGSTAAR
jgi:D-alanyl-D-alanine dipeptidase